MSEFYVVYDAETGEVRWRGQGPDGSAAVQDIDQGLAVMVIPAQAVRGAEVDLDVIRSFAMKQVDREAEAFRLRFVSDGAGQMLTYTTKAAEAKAYIGDSSSAVPFLTAEAAARGMTVAALADEVTAMVEQWTVIGSAIEGTRMGAKAALARATNLAEISAAMAIDWNAVLAA